jgi:uncharacterized protein (TIGR04255 family)
VTLPVYQRHIDVETFPNAPIQEALIDIFATLPSTVSLDALARYHEDVRERFPIRRERSTWTQEFTVQPGQQAQFAIQPQAINGYLYVSEADGKIVQVRMDGFTFNKLRPYTDWRTFVAEAKELWDRYRTIATPANVTKIALRYINRIELPLPIAEFRDYCLLFPEFPPKIPQSLAAFFLRFVTPIAEVPGAVTSTTLTFEPPGGKATLPLILDIHTAQEFEVMDPASDLMWSKMESLRTVKNDIFFESLTNKAKILFR